MKLPYTKAIVAACGALLLQGCVAFPPLVTVEHKNDSPPALNEEVLRRLDQIDRRLDKLEQTQAEQGQRK